MTRLRWLVLALAVALLGVGYFLSRPLGDTEEDLFPNPIDRQAFRLRLLSQVVERFEQNSDSLPETLVAALLANGARPAAADQASIDLWGTPLAYERGRASFRIRSAGPDAVTGTADDMEVTWVRPDSMGQSTSRPTR